MGGTGIWYILSTDRLMKSFLRSAAMSRVPPCVGEAAKTGRRQEGLNGSFQIRFLRTPPILHPMQAPRQPGGMRPRSRHRLWIAL